MLPKFSSNLVAVFDTTVRASIPLESWQGTSCRIQVCALHFPGISLSIDLPKHVHPAIIFPALMMGRFLLNPP
jgi:hypothetical protein